jgi:hypothetical protein
MIKTSMVRTMITAIPIATALPGDKGYSPISI